MRCAPPISAVYRIAILLLLATTLCGPQPKLAQAQDGRIVGELLRELIKSELERRQRNPLQPITPVAPEPPQTRAAAEFEQNVRNVRGFCNTFAIESAALIRAMERNAGRYAGLHNHLDEVRKLQALASYIHQNLGESPRRHVVLNELAQLDSQWRLAKYHLEQVPELPNDCRRHVERLDRLNKQICDPFDIDPQFNRRELVRHLEALAAELHHLERDVQFEVRSANQARELALQLQNLETRARLLSDATISGEPYDEIVAEYNAMITAWNPVAQKLYALNNVHVNRTFEQVRQIDQRVSEQLWLPQAVDTAHIAHITSIVSEQVRSLLGAINLPILLKTEDSNGLMRDARALNQSLDELCECALSGASHQDLLAHWERFDAAWRAFDNRLLLLKSPRVQNQRQLTMGHLADLRDSLGIQLVFDRRQVQQYAAEIDGIADQLLFHVARWQRRPGSNMPSNLPGLTNEFAAASHRFHDECLSRQAQQQQLFNRCNTLFNSWEKLRVQLLKCNSPDRTAIVRVADKSTNCLLHLQALLQL